MKKLFLKAYEHTTISFAWACNQFEGGALITLLFESQVDAITGYQRDVYSGYQADDTDIRRVSKFITFYSSFGLSPQVLLYFIVW